MDNQVKNTVVQIHTEEIDEIITRIPSWTLRWGIVSLGVMIMVVIWISTIIRYPEIIRSTISFVGDKIASPLTVDNTCYARNVMVRQNETVKKGQQLITTESQDLSHANLTLNAEQDGTVSFPNPVYAGMRISSGQVILIINPPHNEFQGLMRFFPNDINKIKLRQSVNIRLTKSLSKYETIKGRISFIADEPAADGLFTVQVALNDPKQRAELKNWMKGSAEIVTQDLTLFQRIFYKLIRRPTDAL